MTTHHHRHGFGEQMLADMAEQPAVLAALQQRSEEIRSLLAPYGLPTATAFVARGTSLHAAIYGRYRLELATCRPAYRVPPSPHTRYQTDTNLDGALGIGLSQSGATPEIVDSLASMRNQGAVTLAITNVGDSPLADIADLTIDLYAGTERAIPATKTFTAQLAALQLVADGLSGERTTRRAWTTLIAGLAHQLADTSELDDALAVARGAQHVVCLGRGLLYPIALEAALKIVETSRLPTSGYSSTEFLHGPIAQASPRGIALCFVEDDDLLTDTLDVAYRLEENRMPIVAIGPSADLIPNADAHLTTQRSDSSLAPILHIERAQQFAHALALHHAQNPDHPDGLSKVTATD